MDITCENSAYTDTFSKSHITPEIPNILQDNCATTNQRYNTRSSSVRHETNNMNLSQNETVFDYVDPNYQAEPGATPRYNTRSAMNANKRRFYGGEPQRYNFQTRRKQRRRKKSNKTKLSVQKFKYDFKQLSPEDQRLFMEEMTTETNLKEALPMQEYVSDNKLKIYNIKQYLVQIDPIAGDYVTQATDNIMCSL